MKLWKLSRLNDDVGYDEYDSFIIRAETEEQARKLIGLTKEKESHTEWAFGDEGAEVWLNPKRSKCEEIKLDGKAELILGSFNAG